MNVRPTDADTVGDNSTRRQRLKHESGGDAQRGIAERDSTSSGQLPDIECRSESTASLGRTVLMIIAEFSKKVLLAVLRQGFSQNGK